MLQIELVGDHLTMDGEQHEAQIGSDYAQQITSGTWDMY